VGWVTTRRRRSRAVASHDGPPLAHIPATRAQAATAARPEAEIGPAKCKVAGASERGYSNSGTVNCTIASAWRGQSSTAKGIERPCN
jgi:hypothetical protein